MDPQKRATHQGVEILVAEDSPTQAEQLKHLLTEQGYTVRVAANDKQALAAMHQCKPTLIISDVVMPEMGGYALCKEIKSQAELKDVPVILLTSLSKAQDVIKGLECGADNFIRKPYDEKYLLSRVDYILMNRELRTTEKMQMGLAVYFGGQRHFITSERQQILDLLISTYEGAVQINEELEARQKELKRSEEELRNQTRILQSILESMGDGVIVADENGKFLLFNAAAEQILGIGPTETTPDQWTERYGLYLTDTVTPYPANELPLARAIRGESVDSAEAFARHSRLPQGVWLNATARPLKDRGGALRGGVVVFRDVTNSKRAEEALVRAKEEAERTSRFKDQFLSTMSHELRTPLNAVLGFSELLGNERYGTLNERQSRYATHIHTSGQHLLRLINDILDLSKIEAGRMELAIENVSIEDASAEALSVLRPLAEKKSQTLSHHAEPDLAARADPMRLKQILMNLLGNAIKFTPAGGHVELSARRMNDGVRVAVQDTGPGIPPEEQQHIFEAFYRLRKSGESTEGTGLGLTITQRLLELQGGRLAVDSQPGQGSCFHFSLPVASPVPQARPQKSEPTGKSEGPLRILVIEDDPVAGQLIRTHLTASGYEVVLCNQLGRGAEMAAEVQPDAITLDMLMEPTGWELLVRLRNDARTASVPIILVTCVDQPGMGAALGADEYLVKPVERAALLAALERQLAGRGSALPKRPILVVEDDTPTREVITELLTDQGYAVATAPDGAEARAQVAASLPELVILDLLLPKVSGLELLAEWRADGRTADLPVFVLTSKDLTREEETRLRAHAELLLRKQQPWQQTMLNQLRRVVAQNAPET